MNSRQVLDMLDSNRIEELRKKLQDDIYEKSLKTKAGAKQRYTAMKKYFKYHTSARECLQKPCKIKFEGEDYISFTNSWSLVLTKEDCGEIELFNEENGKYPDVGRLIRFDGIKKKMDFNDVIAQAKALGYRLNKAEVDSRFKFLMLYDGTYYKIGLIDASWSIIDDGEIALTYHPDGERMPMTIQTSLGMAMIMPVKFEGEPGEDHIVIEVPCD
jgi:hypothetical protein